MGMPNGSVVTALVVLALALGAAPAAAEPAPVTSATAQDPALQSLQALFDSYVSTGKVPGIVAAIGRGDAPPTFVSAGRIADDPVASAAGPDSLWRIYSMTKPITAAAAMILIDEGKLRLDQPVSDFIPAFRMMRVLDARESSLASHPVTHPITIRNLLTHTSGLGYQIIGTGPLPREYQRLGLLGGRADAEASKAQPKSLEEFANRVATVPLLAEPGTEWNYSISLDILGRVIEVASGVPFDRFVESRLLKPLGMTSTYWTVPRSEAGRLATLYAWQNDRSIVAEPGATSLWLDPPLVPYGGSGLVSSARDYDRFLRMLADGGALGGVRILRRQTVALALSNLLPPAVRVVSNVTPASIVAEGFGAGGSLYLNDVPNGVGAGTYGWFGAAGTIAFIDPKYHLRVTVMVNYAPVRQWPLYTDIVKAIYSK